MSEPSLAESSYQEDTKTDTRHRTSCSLQRDKRNINNTKTYSEGYSTRFGARRKQRGHSRGAAWTGMPGHHRVRCKKNECEKLAHNAKRNAMAASWFVNESCMRNGREERKGDKMDKKKIFGAFCLNSPHSQENTSKRAGAWASLDNPVYSAIKVCMRLTHFKAVQAPDQADKLPHPHTAHYSTNKASTNNTPSQLTKKHTSQLFCLGRHLIPEQRLIILFVFF